ncbi:MAG: agmatinase family protein [Bacteroidota bacterium]|nr:agmatinase family protein [Bacteroidota bacterium]MDP4214735.1 agmatinase family protein [Bacteroidota bacterium]MDP4248147.1 agmatinase family protein [Bacteroidota bacterium]MDP4253290.1 agmatinase family protein [Bacteroidota bacterium]MDP4257676.1 agmatinase family protein [Bacteroidota bacterium]
MTDLSQFNANGPSNPKNNIFGLPFTEEEARVVILPVPWEVTVSYGAGTSRAAEHIFQASMQVDLFDSETNESWRKGIFMRQPDRKVLMKSDYLRKEAELYINYTSKGEMLEKNTFMCKSLREINEGSAIMNNWVYEQTRDLLANGKLVVLLGGDHSVPLGYFKAVAEKHGDFGILQIDAHCDLRKCYENFVYSHASVMYNALQEIPQLKRLVQVGVRDYSEEEWEYISNSNYQVITYFDRDIKERGYEGQTWKQIADEIVSHLPDKVYISFDIDGLDPKLCPCTGTPVQGGFEVDQVLYLIKKIVQSGRKFIGFDLVEVGVGETGFDANVGARILWKLSNLLVASNP